jgi:hypothetical protein
VTRRLHLALLVLSLGACAERSGSADSTGTAAVPSPSAGTVGQPGNPACPATGLWSQCAIVERLDRSGLAPRVDSTVQAEEPPLTAKGFFVHVGRADLEVFLYESQGARERDQARLDSTRYVQYTQPPTMAQQPTLIASANVLAILHSMNSHQRERVGDAITAGAPAKAP